MQRDIRQDRLFTEVEEFFLGVHGPGFGRICSANDLNVSSVTRQIAFVGRTARHLNQPARSHICLLDGDGGQPVAITDDRAEAIAPRWSPDGMRLAFLSDRSESGVMQPYVFRRNHIGEAEPIAAFDGTVENHAWSPDGARMLFIVAGHGANMAGMEGATTVGRKEKTASWLPLVETGREDYRWRRLWLYDFVAARLKQLIVPGLTVWEAAWCGNDKIAAIVSAAPGEYAWYQAEAVIIDIQSGKITPIYKPAEQIGLPMVAPDGSAMAVVEAVSSDRKVIAGDVLLIDPVNTGFKQLDLNGVDVTGLTWRDANRLLYAGHRGLQTVVGEFDKNTGKTREIWVSQERTCGEWYPVAAPLGDTDCVVVTESFLQQPEILRLSPQGEKLLASLGHAGVEHVSDLIGDINPVSWSAPDGLEIQGWLLKPAGAADAPTIMEVHGGPVYCHRPFWLGTTLARTPLSMLWRGYACFLPNPRGSSGRGRAFAAHVRGDMGGLDTMDYLSGLDHLSRTGLIGSGSIGVTGSSYGGFMTCWLVTQDTRFSAAVARYPVSNWYSQHFTSAIPYFDELFLGGRIGDPEGRHHLRSPVMHARHAQTPTFLVAGALDQSTPPGQALEFHRALTEYNVDSALAIYPQGIHGFLPHPEATDYVARLIYWFEKYMPATARVEKSKGHGSIARLATSTR